MAEEYGLSKSELAQIDAMAAAANKPNINLMAGMIAGDPQTANMSSQIQAQQHRGGQQRVAGLRGALQAKATQRDTASRQGVLQSSKVKAKTEADALARKQVESDYERDRKDDLADLQFKKDQALELAELRNKRSTASSNREKFRLDRQERQFRMRHHKTQQPKTLSNSESSTLAESGKTLGVMNDSLRTFKDSYVSTVGAKGRVENFFAAETGIAMSQEVLDQAAWWRQYKRFIELVERHEFFGATLTKGENISWKQAEIQQGMPAEEVRLNLRKRIKIMEDHLGNYAKGIAISRKNPVAVQALLGKHLPGSYMPAKEEYYEPFPEDIVAGEIAGEVEGADLMDIEDDDLRQRMVDAGLDPSDHGL